jgi:hypothetical protein
VALIYVLWRAGLLAGRAEIPECLFETRSTVGQEANPPSSVEMRQRYALVSGIKRYDRSLTRSVVTFTASMRLLSHAVLRATR